MLTVYPGPSYFGGSGSATTTIDASGNLTDVGTLGVTGLSTFTGGAKVGASGTQLNQVISGYCVTGSITIPATNASSTQTYATCTPSGGVTLTGNTANRVFVEATSSLPYYIVAQAASSTAAGLIQVSFTNFSTTTSPAATIYALNFWAFQ